MYFIQSQTSTDVSRIGNEFVQYGQYFFLYVYIPISPTTVDQNISIRAFWSFLDILVKNCAERIIIIQKIFFEFDLYEFDHVWFFNQNVVSLQNVLIPPDLYTTDVLFNKNVLIPPNCILPTPSWIKCFNTSILYTTETHFYNSTIKIVSISFFSSSGRQKFHHLLGCHVIDINSSCVFFKFLCVFQIWYAWQISCPD